MAAEFKIKKKKLGSYPFVSVVFSITLALFVIGLFGVLLIYSQELSRLARENVTMQVYLKNQLPEDQSSNIRNRLEESRFILTHDGKKEMRFISKDEAANTMIKKTGEDFKKFLGENPLRDAYLIFIDPAYHSRARLAEVRTAIEKLPGVFQVYYEENLIESVNKNLAQIGLVLIGMASLLLIIVVLLIHNTLRLALFSQRFLIRSMQLVGATKSFIQGPFLLRAAMHGALSGILAAGLLYAIIRYGHQKIQDLNMVQNKDRLMILLGGLLTLGIVVAVISTWRAVRRYLKLSLDELY